MPPVTDDPRPFTARDPIRARRPREGDYLGAVSATRFYVKYQTIINSIHHALQLHHAEFGEYPSSHDEFMEKIIGWNNFPLPELPAGQEYIFVPEEAELGLQIRLTPAQSDDAE